MLLVLLRRKWSSSYAGNSIYLNLFLRFVASVFFHQFFFLKQLVQDLLPPLSIYIHLCTFAAPLGACHASRGWCSGGLTNTYIRIHICRDLVHLDSSGPPGISSRSLGSHRVPRLCIGRVCVRIHTHMPTYTTTRVKKYRNTDNTSILPSVKNDLPRQAISAFTD